jgi:lipopolysaccharide export system permease protein
MLKFSKLETYIFFRFSQSFLSILFGLTIAIWLVRVLNDLDHFLSIGASLGLVVQFSFYLLAPVFANVISLGFLFACLSSFNRFLQEREYFVMAAAGITPLGFFKPIFILTIMVTILLGVFNFYVSPYAAQQLRKERAALTGSVFVGAVKPGVFVELANQVTVFAAQKTERGVLKNILIYDSRETDSTVIYMAKEAVFMSDDEQKIFQLVNGQVETTRIADASKHVLTFDNYVFPLEKANDQPFNLTNLSPSQLMLHQLVGPGKILMTDERKLIRIRAYLNQMVSELLSPLIFALIAFCVMVIGGLRRSGYFYRISSGVLLSVGFYGGVIILSGLASQQASLIGLLVAWPIGILFCLMIYIYRRFYSSASA